MVWFSNCCRVQQSQNVWMWVCEGDKKIVLLTCFAGFIISLRCAWNWKQNMPYWEIFSTTCIEGLTLCRNLSQGVLVPRLRKNRLVKNILQYIFTNILYWWRRILQYIVLVVENIAIYCIGNIKYCNIFAIYCISLLSK